MLFFQDAVSGKKKDLMGQLHFHKLIKDINEIVIWITEMLQIANDECYKDTSKLKGKKKQHNGLLDKIEMKKVKYHNLLPFSPFSCHLTIICTYLLL